MLDLGRVFTGEDEDSRAAAWGLAWGRAAGKSRWRLKVSGYSCSQGPAGHSGPFRFFTRWPFSPTWRERKTP